MPRRGSSPDGTCESSEEYRKEDVNAYQAFRYSADEHDTCAKTFSFPIYGNGCRTIPERGASAGMQDGLDLITATGLAS